jgi:hypothetical protein
VVISGGGSDLTRRHHVSGGPCPHSLKAECRGGGVRYGLCVVDLSAQILAAEICVMLSTMRQGRPTIKNLG